MHGNTGKQVEKTGADGKFRKEAERTGKSGKIFDSGPKGDTKIRIPFTGDPDFCMSRRGSETALDVLLKLFSYIDGEIHIRYNCIYGISIMLRGGLKMEVQLKPWGNSQGIRLPKSVLHEAGFEPDDHLIIKAEAGKIVLIRSFHHRTLEERAAEYGGKLNLDGELDWRGDPVGNEVW